MCVSTQTRATVLYASTSHSCAHALYVTNILLALLTASLFKAGTYSSTAADAVLTFVAGRQDVHVRRTHWLGCLRICLTC